MKKQTTKQRIKRLAAGALALAVSAGVSAHMTASNLPDLGTAAVNTLSIEKEMQVGDAYMRVIRGSAPMVTDPVLEQYLSELGNKLVSHAHDVKTPFTFFMLRQDEINAFAFFGGHVGIHTGLFLNADNEAQLASVLAHEIVHVTQRHLARSMEAQQKTGPAAMVGMLGAILLAIAAPQAGMAALATTQALAQQSSINYTRAHEREADRIGIAMLAEAGFDPQGAPEFFAKLAARYRYSSKPPQMLLTHPLPESRISEARTRAANYPRRRYEQNLDYHLARARIWVRYSPLNDKAALARYDMQLKKRDYEFKEAALYGRALALFRLKRYEESQQVLEELIKNDKNNLFYVDLKTDLLLEQDKNDEAIAMLKHQLKLKPTSQVVLANLANAYMQDNQPELAINKLQSMAFLDKDYMLPYSMMVDAYKKTGEKAQRHLAQAELMALAADYDNAIDQLNYAYKLTTEEPLQTARIEARLRQFRKAKRDFEDL
ncbi:M48 family metalloprotease [Paraferrimonas sedimenticola]|uniref:Putative beta-barrel assembly-enhancing protease n=1 Tax=Paraferrimonas sedimenticola TaxID=375674 RepID=A0AA37RU16_9GAMM|nr:M48 family metalloprotease [Paraferrimonas sedimenticola]GLP94769.1 putative beta-barrel assembly-enhancing protease [Paraferrimonas sedimenticola]